MAGSVGARALTGKVNKCSQPRWATKAREVFRLTYLTFLTEERLGRLGGCGSADAQGGAENSYGPQRRKHASDDRNGRHTGHVILHVGTCKFARYFLPISASTLSFARPAAPEHRADKQQGKQGRQTEGNPSLRDLAAGLVDQ